MTSQPTPTRLPDCLKLRCPSLALKSTACGEKLVDGKPVPLADVANCPLRESVREKLREAAR